MVAMCTTYCNINCAYWCAVFTYCLWFTTLIISLYSINGLVFIIYTGCVLCDVWADDLCIPILCMNVSLHQIYKLWKLMLLVIEGMPHDLENVKPCCKSSPLFHSVLWSSFSEPSFRGGTPKIIFHIPRNPYLWKTGRPEEVDSGKRN